MRGCLELPVSETADERCYNLMNSEHLRELAPLRTTGYSYDLLAIKDEVQICREDDCNNEVADLARFCVDDSRESGVGNLAANIIQNKASSVSVIHPVVIVLGFLIWFFVTI